MEAVKAKATLEFYVFRLLHYCTDLTQHNCQTKRLSEV